ncbi:hypothetical protein [Streptomyces sp. NPDC050988]|uniref:hypothetical protein n=1 Tax=Streptomyces sp. NPDC050988 TaxID=3365637 RepID=UPI0037AEDFEF
MSRTIPLLLSLFATLTLLVATASTARAFLLAQSSSYEAREARQRAVSHWAGAVLVTGVVLVVRARLNATGAGASGHGSVSIPWAAVGLVAACLAAAAVVLGVVAVGVRAGLRQRDRDRAAQRVRSAVRERIASGVARHDAVFEEYGAHLVDFLAALERPSLNDPSVAETERFDRARIAADDARLAVRLSPEEAQVAAYLAAVAELEVSWRIARDHAERVGTSYLEPAVSRRLAKAADLVPLVTGGASDHERVLAYLRVRQLVGRSVRVSQQAERAIERLARPALDKAMGGLQRPIDFDQLARAGRALGPVVTPGPGARFEPHSVEDVE